MMDTPATLPTGNTESAISNPEKKSKSGTKIIMILLVIFFLLILLVAGGAAGAYFLYLKPNKEKLDKVNDLDNQITKVDDQIVKVSDQYDIMKDHILRFNEQDGTDDDIKTETPLINVLGASTQDHEAAEEAYLKELTEAINDNLSKLKVKGFSSKNKDILQELPQTGEDSYLAATDAAQAVAVEGLDKSSDLQEALDSLKTNYDSSKLTDPKLKEEYNKYITDTQAYIDETESVFQFYEMALQLSADYYRADAALYDQLNFIFESDDPTPYLSSLEESKQSFEEMLDKLNKYDDSSIPEELVSLHEMNKEVLEITIDFVDDEISAVEALDIEAFYNNYVKYLSDRLNKNTTYNRNDVKFWKGSKNSDKYDALLEQSKELKSAVTNLKDKYKSPI